MTHSSHIAVRFQLHYADVYATMLPLRHAYIYYATPLFCRQDTLRVAATPLMAPYGGAMLMLPPRHKRATPCCADAVAIHAAIVVAICASLMIASHDAPQDAAMPPLFARRIQQSVAAYYAVIIISYRRRIVVAAAPPRRH